jgi:hypothetical protein
MILFCFMSKLAGVASMGMTELLSATHGVAARYGNENWKLRIGSL